MKEREQIIQVENNPEIVEEGKVQEQLPKREVVGGGGGGAGRGGGREGGYV